MIEFDKDEIKNGLSLQNIFDVVEELGGEPVYTDFGLICLTICHNEAHTGSRKLYYYENTNLFRCYTGCQDTFDIFDLIIKAKKINNNEDYTLGKAVFYIIYKFNLSNQLHRKDNFEEQLKDWEVLKHYDNLENQEPNNIDTINTILPEFNKIILTRFQ